MNPSTTLKSQEKPLLRRGWGGYVRHLRPLNLLMVAITQAVCCWHLLRDVMPWQDAPVWELAVLVFSTVCITAAGYLINDYYDIAIDVRNKPQKALGNSTPAKRNALLLYGLLNGVGVVAAVPAALAAGKPLLISVQLITVALLWWYSAVLKRLPVIGNLVVAGLTALSIWLPYAFLPQYHDAFQYHLRVEGLALFAVYSFLLTWLREMVKDIEDLEGDRAEGCRTLPIVWGARPVVHLVSGLTVLLIAALLAGMVFCFLYLHKGMSFLILSGMIAPLSYWLYKLRRAETATDFGRASNLLKAVMISGFLILLILHGGP